MARKCEFTGCKREATWVAAKLWGKGGTICTCDEHRPGSNPLPAHLAPERPWYDVKPIGGETR
jgi:hypothetical protein